MSEVGVRKAINDHPTVAASIAIGLCLLVGVALWWEMGSAGASTDIPVYANKAFYSDDGGATWFIDDASKLAPFDHNGKQAYQAMLFRRGNGKPFVGYIQKVPDAVWKQVSALRAAQAQRDPSRPPNALPAPGIPMDVKKPGDSQWLSAAAPAGSKEADAYRQVLSPRGPDGSAASVVLPGEPDAH